MRSLLLLAALLAAACLAHGAEPTTPRRSLTLDLLPTRPRSASDKDKCLKSLLALGLCKHELLLASLFPGRRVPPACCRAADEVDDHCGPLTRSVVWSLLPRDLLQRCAWHQGVPLAPPLAAGGGARAPPVPEAQESARVPPPGAPRVSGVNPPPSYPRTAPSGNTPPTPPKVVNGTQAPVVSGKPRVAEGPRVSSKPVNETAPKPKVVAGGAHAPPVPDNAQAGARAPPPRGTRISGGSSVHPPPAYPRTANTPPSPKVASGKDAPVVPGSPRVAEAPRISSKPVNETAPTPKVVAGGAHSPPVPDKAQAGARAPPPRGTSVHPPPAYPRTAPAHPSPKVGGGGTPAPVVYGSPREAGAPRISAVPVNETAPKPKVIAGGGRARRAPGVYVPAAGAPLAAASVPRKGASTATTWTPRILP